MTGKIARIVKEKGFGFIRDDAGSERFFHSSGCLVPFDSLREGQEVSFEPEKSNKGPRCNNVKPLED